jgi:hypothetical protein
MATKNSSSVYLPIERRIEKMGAPALRSELKYYASCVPQEPGYMAMCVKKDKQLLEYNSFFAQLRQHLNVEERD